MRSIIPISAPERMRGRNSSSCSRRRVGNGSIAVVTSDHEVVVAAHEVEACELEHERLVEAGLKVPVEGFERLALDEPAGVDAPRDALLELVRGLEAEDVL